MSGWSILFWLIISFALLYPLNRWITTHIQGVAFLLTGSQAVAVWLFWTLFLPGTLLHEISHWVTAQILGVKTSRFSLWPTVKRRGELQMGSVQVEVADPFRHSLIGLAPLIFGSLVVLWIGQGWLGLARVGRAFSSGDLTLMGQAILDTLAVPDVWLWLYLIFAISNAMLPSASDRESWWSVLLYLTLGLMLVVGSGLTPTVSPDVQRFSLTILAALLSAFLMTIAVNVVFIIFIILIELIVSLILGRRVQYNR